MATKDCRTEVYGRIYCVTNVSNGKQYVGQTTRSLGKRWHEHRSDQGYCRLLQNAIKKHGPDKFTIQQLAIAHSREELDRVETEWIERIRSVAPLGYNLRTGGGSNGTFAEETKALCREITKVLWTDPDYRQRASSGLRRMFDSPEALRKRHEAIALANATPEARENNRRAKLASWENNHSRKALHSAQAKERAADPEFMKRWKAACAESTRSESKKQKNRDAMNAQWADPAFRQKVKEARQLPEVKAARSAVIKAYWDDPEWKARWLEIRRSNIRKKTKSAE